MRELDDRRKIQYLLALCGSSTDDGTTYFRDKIHKDIVSKEEKPETEELTPKEKEALFRETETNLENQSLKLRLSALQTQMDEQVFYSQF